ncbi:GNAT family N-acetyltransferase [Gynurincola endophyticus]|uniref:GNAT family N-acetyltransferase n=1 Tax=Gynurincola endophyticus TaxID=2479004 RepID=UPI000F8D8026|nr:GNAT family protein [Gynurincola endophyticus]
METFPSIKTSRLILDELTLADVPLMVKHLSNPAIAAVTLNIPYPYSEKDALSWIYHADQCFKAESHFIFAIRQKKDKAFIGCISLALDKRHHRTELSYWLAEPFWGKGLVTEAAKSIMYFAFNTLQLNKITANHIVENPASGKVMVKCGMLKEGYLKQHIHKKDRFYDIVIYGLTKEEYTKL